MKRYLIILLICAATPAVAQDIHFSQFYENSILRNPALTGIYSGDYKVGANYRTQWSNIATPFQTFLISGETRILVNREVGDYFSFGATATYDKAGSISFNSLQVYPAVNYNKSLEDRRNSYLSVGFAGGYTQRSIDFSKATFSTQYVNGTYSAENMSGENFTNTTVENYDVAAGISLNSSFGPSNEVNYYAGFAAYHINRPKQTFNEENNALIVLKTKYSGNLGFSWRITREFGFTGHFNYYQQGTFTEIIGGGLVSWRAANTESDNQFKLYAGAFVRAKDAIIPTLKLDYQNYSVIFSYDVNTSSLQTATAGSGGYEISFYLNGNYNRSNTARSSVSCPRFEQMLTNTPGTFDN